MAIEEPHPCSRSPEEDIGGRRLVDDASACCVDANPNMNMHLWWFCMVAGLANTKGSPLLIDSAALEYALGYAVSSSFLRC